MFRFLLLRLSYYCTLEISDLRRCHWLSLNRDHINLPMVNFMLCRVMFGTSDHMLTLAGCDGFFRQPQLVQCPCFDFDEDDALALFCNDVNFAIRCADVSSNDLATVLREIFGGCLFAPLADVLMMFHFKNSSRIVIKRSSSLGLSGFVF